MIPNALKRFLKYSSVGVSTFLFDLFLLYIFIDFLLWHHVFSAGLAFLIAVSINYLISRRWVFRGTLRSIHLGYSIFLLIIGVGFFAVLGLMFVFVDILMWNYLISRIAIAGIVGIWNYLMNLYVNFKVAGKHE